MNKKITVTGGIYFRDEGTENFRMEFDAAEWDQWDEDERHDKVNNKLYDGDYETTGTTYRIAESYLDNFMAKDT